jgi:CHAT domain-containing protein/tetratricopeptide (TPR) repeat protein
VAYGGGSAIFRIRSSFEIIEDQVDRSSKKAIIVFGGNMTSRLTVDLLGDDLMKVGFLGDGNHLEAVAELPEGWPPSIEAFETIRWYLEDCLTPSFPDYGLRALEVQTELRRLGLDIFGSVFGDTAIRDAYRRAQESGQPVELLIRSASPELMAAPWELMLDPQRGKPVAVDVKAMSRSLPAAEFGAPVEVRGSRLRVLVVIGGHWDVRDGWSGFRISARRLLERLSVVTDQVDLVVLRPATLKALKEVLNSAESAGDPFHVVHFDGQLVQLESSGQLGTAGNGEYETGLVMRSADGSASIAEVGNIAAVLRESRVPLTILTPCQPESTDKALGSTMAIRLLETGGATAVVVQPYSMQDISAAEFLATFYEGLCTGETVSAAVTRARRRLYERGQGTDPGAAVSSSDWTVPVQYLRHEVRFPSLARTRSAPVRQEGKAGNVFVGRDALFFELEVIFGRQRVVVLHGDRGIGKTASAQAFVRWWQTTGGTERQSLVFWQSFEPGLMAFGSGGIFTRLGRGLFGEQFDSIDRTEHLDILVQTLREQRIVLVWDDFQAVRSRPYMDAWARFDVDSQTALRNFLGRVSAPGGASVVLVVSETPEDWLGQVGRLTVGKLNRREAVEYTGLLISSIPDLQSQIREELFGELIDWLNGHPLATQIVLRLLITTPLGELLAGLRATSATAGEGDGEAESLRAALTYSFKQLGTAAQRLLPAVSLCWYVADANLLFAFSQIPSAPDRFREASREHWVNALAEGGSVGLLTSINQSMYQVHEVLSEHLGTQWHADNPAQYETERAAAENTMMVATALLADWFGRLTDPDDADFARWAIRWQRCTFETMLGRAIANGQWDLVRPILEALGRWWAYRPATDDEDSWNELILAAVQEPAGTPPSLDSDAGHLWLYIAWQWANRQRRSMRLDNAEATITQILAALHAQPSFAEQRPSMAAALDELGVIAQERGRPQDAEKRHRASLAIWEELGNQRGIANACYELGNAHQAQGQLDEAEDWHSKSLAIREYLDDDPGRASSYHLIGIICQEQGRLEEAEEWHNKAAAIQERLGDEPGLARSFHELGNAAYQRDQLDAAESWHRRSLKIKETLRNRQGMANSYHQLGNISQDRNQLLEAERWYREALSLREEMDDVGKIPDVYYELGNIAQKRDHLEDAEDYYNKCIAMYEDIGSQRGLGRTYGQLGLLAESRGQNQLALQQVIRSMFIFGQLTGTWSAPDLLIRLSDQHGLNALQDAWLRITGSPLPAAVRELIDDRGSDSAASLALRGARLLQDAMRSCDLTGLNISIEMITRALKAAPAQLSRASMLSNLSMALRSRYLRTGSIADLDFALVSAQDAVAACPADHPVRARSLIALSDILLTRFDETHLQADLDEAIALAQEAVTASADDDHDKDVPLISLGYALHERFLQSRQLEDLDAAIEIMQKAVNSCPADHPDRAAGLVGLSAFRRSRFARTSESTDLEASVSAAQEALVVTPTGDPFRAKCLINLSDTLLSQAEHSGKISDADDAVITAQEAVEAIPAQQPDHGWQLRTLSIALRHRHELSGARTDLDAAVAAAREAADAVQAAEKDYSTFQMNLAIVLRSRFILTGATEDLDGSVISSQRAVSASDPEDPELATRLNILGLTLHSRFDHVGAIEDINAAVVATVTAMQASQAGQAIWPALLTNLGLHLQARFEAGGPLEDIEAAVTAAQAAIEYTPAHDPEIAARLSNLGIALHAKFEETGDQADLHAAVDAGQESVNSTSAAHHEWPVRLSSLGSTLLARFQQAADPTDLIRAITALREALNATPADHSRRAGRLANLAQALQAQFALTGSQSDLDATLDAWRSAASADTSPPRLRVQAAREWGRIAAAGSQWLQAVRAFGIAVELLALVAPRNVARRDQEVLLGSLGDLAPEATACCIHAGMPDRAIELFENGRGILLSQALDTRTDLTALGERYPDLAQRFVNLRDNLDSVTSDGLPSDPSTINSAADYGPDGHLAGQQRRETALEFERLVAEIRVKAEFANFLRPLTFRELAVAADDGPVVMLNVSKFGSHALLLTRDGVLKPLPLPKLTPERVEEQADEFMSAVESMPEESGEDRITAVLRWLWDSAAAPVLERLNLSEPLAGQVSWPRLWWCVSGTLSFLPLHAAGYHDTRSAALPKTVIDRVVSSYTPTIRALMHARRSDAAGDQIMPDMSADVMAVAMPITPQASNLPGAAAEADVLRRTFPGRVKVLHGAEATYDTVKDAMPRARWAHFACHGFADPADPSASHLLLNDHLTRPLTVVDVARLRMTNADLAFLSACSTARPGRRLTNEAIHLASAFQLAGYRHVIGTLWPITDRAAVSLTSDVYNTLASSGTVADTATALHSASRTLRDLRPQNPSIWAAHVHSGS